MVASRQVGRFYVVRWMVAGAAFGLAMQLAAWWVAIRDGGAMSFSELHDRHPVMWLIDMLPTILGFAGAAIGVLHQRLVALRQGVEDRAREIAAGWTSELNATNHDLAETLQMRQRFVASVSHELRTPLSAIVGYSELAEALAVSPSEVREYVSEIYRAALSLLDIVNDLLDVARLEFGGFSLDVTEVAASAVASEVVDRLRPLAEQQGLRLVLDTEAQVTVRADPARLRQVLTNLISNAVKYSDGGEIVVQLGSDGDDDGWIEVADQGRGIAAEDLDRIFAPFTQAGEARSDSTGLGLGIARTFVEAMGGTLVAHSAGPGTGSRFRVTLPAGRDRQLSDVVP